MPFSDGWVELDPLLRQLKQKVTNILGNKFELYVETERDGSFKTKRERYSVTFVLHCPAANSAAIVDKRVAMYLESNNSRGFSASEQPRLFVQVLPQRFLDKMFKAIEKKNQSK